MIPTKPRRIKSLKLSKNLERQYIQTKCRDCSVVVTRMDFAKILGKFTKVKIKFETNNTPKTKQTGNITSRLKANENGALPARRSAYNPHPARNLYGISKKAKYDTDSSPPRSPNILKESNRIKKATEKSNTDYKIGKTKNGATKYYHIVFSNPIEIKTEIKSEINLDSLLPDINNEILPSNEWCIDYFPKKGEPKDDKIYDRIAAELEDLMYNEKTKNVDNKEGKSDEFPSILDILNDTSKVPDKPNQSSKNLESSDVEAMLLGESKPTPMDVDKLNTQGDETKKSALDDNPNSPSILEEPEPMEVPVLSLADKPLVLSPKKAESDTSQSAPTDVNENTHTKNKNTPKSGVTQVIFKKSTNGTSSKTVICPKNLKYSVSIQGKSIELLGAPKMISSLEDLQVLLQIVEESEPNSVYLL